MFKLSDDDVDLKEMQKSATYAPTANISLIFFSKLLNPIHENWWMFNILSRFCGFVGMCSPLSGDSKLLLPLLRHKHVADNIR